MTINIIDELILKYEIEAICNDCGDFIKEARYYNKNGELVHISTGTNGHYYNDNTARCEECHDASRK